VKFVRMMITYRFMQGWIDVAPADEDVLISEPRHSFDRGVFIARIVLFLELIVETMRWSGVYHNWAGENTLWRRDIK
jgi:hypothetical protein